MDRLCRVVRFIARLWNIFEPLKAKLIIENRMRGCMEENYFLDQRKINRQIQL